MKIAAGVLLRGWDGSRAALLGCAPRACRAGAHRGSRLCASSCAPGSRAWGGCKQECSSGCWGGGGEGSAPTLGASAGLEQTCRSGSTPGVLRLNEHFPSGVLGFVLSWELCRSCPVAPRCWAALLFCSAEGSACSWEQPEEHSASQLELHCCTGALLEGTCLMACSLMALPGWS